MTKEERKKRIIEVTKTFQTNTKSKLVSVIFIDEEGFVCSGTDGDFTGIIPGEKLLEYVGHLELMKSRLLGGSPCGSPSYETTIKVKSEVH